MNPGGWQQLCCVFQHVDNSYNGPLRQLLTVLLHTLNLLSLCFAEAPFTLDQHLNMQAGVLRPPLSGGRSGEFFLGGQRLSELDVLLVEQDVMEEVEQIYRILRDSTTDCIN